MPKTAEPGARFRVTGIKEVRDSNGSLLARYHPAHPETGDPLDYGVTPRNVKIVNEMIEAGAAEVVDGNVARGGMNISSGAAKATGKIDVSPKKGKAKK